MRKGLGRRYLHPREPLTSPGLASYTDTESHLLHPRFRLGPQGAGEGAGVHVSLGEHQSGSFH